MCSRLTIDRYGRQVVIVTTPEVGLHVGQTFRVLGNAFPCAEAGVYFLQDAAAERRVESSRRRESLAAAPVDARLKGAVKEDGPTATVEPSSVSY